MVLKRQIRYNLKTDTAEQETFRYRWTFLVINEPREIDRIREKLYREMAPIVDLNELDKGLVRNSNGLHYNFFAFSTDKGRIEHPEKIYDVDSVRFSKDRGLIEIMTDRLAILLNGN
jgi:hypothetical protein